MTEFVAGKEIAGKYRLERVLARGGMGAIWVARQIQLDRLVAIKFMDPALAAAADGRSRFEREARASAQIQSPHVVQVHDYGVADAIPYLVMELLIGEDLAARLRKQRRMSLPAVASILVPVARGLRKAHDAGIVHRDLKPANIFIAKGDDDDEIVKVLDFGIAKVSGIGKASEATATGVLVGSVHYMSPEQARGAKTIDGRSDLWSLAVIAYRALTGRVPFPGEHLGDVIVKICSDTVPKASSIVTDLGPAVDEFFEQALARDPNKRFPNAAEMANAFLALTDGALLLPAVSTMATARKLTIAGAPVPPSARTGPGGSGPGSVKSTPLGALAAPSASGPRAPSSPDAASLATPSPPSRPRTATFAPGSGQPPRPSSSPGGLSPVPSPAASAQPAQGDGPSSIQTNPLTPSPATPPPASPRNPASSRTPAPVPSPRPFKMAGAKPVTISEMPEAPAVAPPPAVAPSPVAETRSTPAPAPAASSASPASPAPAQPSVGSAAKPAPAPLAEETKRTPSPVAAPKVAAKRVAKKVVPVAESDDDSEMRTRVKLGAPVSLQALLAEYPVLDDPTMDVEPDGLGETDSAAAAETAKPSSAQPPPAEPAKALSEKPPLAAPEPAGVSAAEPTPAVSEPSKPVEMLEDDGEARTNVKNSAAEALQAVMARVAAPSARSLDAPSAVIQAKSELASGVRGSSPSLFEASPASGPTPPPASASLFTPGPIVTPPSSPPVAPLSAQADAEGVGPAAPLEELLNGPNEYVELERARAARRKKIGFGVLAIVAAFVVLLLVMSGGSPPPSPATSPTPTAEAQPSVPLSSEPADPAPTASAEPASTTSPASAPSASAQPVDSAAPSAPSASSSAERDKDQKDKKKGNSNTKVVKPKVNETLGI